MFCAAFLYHPGGYDAGFHRLNDFIQAAAEAKRNYARWHQGYHV